MPLIFALILWSLATIAQAGTAVIGWDAVPNANSYRVWRGIEVLATVSTNRAQVTLPDDFASVLTVTTIAANGESAHSESMRVLPLPVMTSGNLRDWTRERTVFVQAPADQAFFKLLPPITQ